MTKINEIRQQRQDRISNILKTLEDNGYIQLIDTSNSKSYIITEKGRLAYLRWIKDFLYFVRTIHS